MSSSVDVAPSGPDEAENLDIPLNDTIFGPGQQPESEDNQTAFPPGFDTLAEAEEDIASTLSGDITNQNRNSIIIRNTFIDKNSSWSTVKTKAENNLECEKPLSNISQCSEVLFPEERELFDQGNFYTAFQDIDISGTLETTGPLRVEDISELDDGGPRGRVLTSADSLEIDRIVRDHDSVYFSVNFGEGRTLERSYHFLFNHIYFSPDQGDVDVQYVRSPGMKHI